LLNRWSTGGGVTHTRQTFRHHQRPAKFVNRRIRPKPQSRRPLDKPPATRPPPHVLPKDLRPGSWRCTYRVCTVPCCWWAGVGPASGRQKSDGSNSAHSNSCPTPAWRKGGRARQLARCTRVVQAGAEGLGCISSSVGWSPALPLLERRKLGLRTEDV
jgi:hypothetical protein